MASKKDTDVTGGKAAAPVKKKFTLADAHGHGISGESSYDLTGHVLDPAGGPGEDPSIGLASPPKKMSERIKKKAAPPDKEGLRLADAHGRGISAESSHDLTGHVLDPAGGPGEDPSIGLAPPPKKMDEKKK